MSRKVHVWQGRPAIHDPGALPNGTVSDLELLDPGDDLDEAARALLHDALQASAEDVAAGRLVDAEEVLEELRGT